MIHLMMNPHFEIGDYIMKNFLTIIPFIVGVSISANSHASEKDIIERCIYTAELIGQIKDHRDGNEDKSADDINERYANSDEGVQLLVKLYDSPEYYAKFENGYHAYIETIKDCSVALLAAKNIGDIKNVFNE